MVTSADQLRVRVLGCGDAFGTGGRLHTCFHFSVPSGAGTDAFEFVIDCGASALIGMKRYGVSPGDIDAAVVTHLHGDHFAGLVFLERESQVAASRTRPLTVIGPPSLPARLAAASDVLFPGSTGAARTFQLDVRSFADSGAAATVGPLTVRAWPGIHTAGTEPHAVRIGVGRWTVAYSGDTEWTDLLLDAAARADLFICEAYTGNRQAKNHMCLADIARHRKELTCRRILLTHLGPEAIGVGPGPGMEVAEDGLELRLD